MFLFAERLRKVSSGLVRLRLGPETKVAKKDRIVAATAVIPFLLLLLAIGFAHRASLRQEQANEHVRQSYRALHQIDATVATLKNAESSARGYLLTGETSLLDTSHDAVRSLPRQIGWLGDRFHSGLPKDARIEQLRQLSDATVAQLTKMIALRETDPHRPGEATASQEEIRPMEAFLAAIKEMQNEEFLYLEKVSSESSKKNRSDNLARFGITALAVITLAALMFLLLRLKQFRRMITICSWTHQIKYEGKWIGLEQYFKDSFGFDATHGISDEAKKRFFDKHASTDCAPPGGALGEDQGMEPPRVLAI